MSSRLLLSGLVALLIACAAYLLWDYAFGDADHSLSSADSNSEASEPPESKETEAHRGQFERTKVSPALDAATRQAASRDADLFPDDWIDILPDREGPILRILDPSGRHGVAGALVSFLPYAGAAREALDHQTTAGDQFLILAAQYGELFETDERGYCPLPRFWRRGQVAATSDQGYLPPCRLDFIEDSGHVIEYELLRCRQYAIKILGSDGAPRSGIDVILQTTQSNPFVFRDDMVSRTNAEGEAWFFEPDFDGPPPKARFSIQTPGHAEASPPAIPLRPRDPLPVHRLGLGGSIIFDLVEPDQIHEVKTVALTIQGSKDGRDNIGPAWTRVVPMGEVRFDDLPLGLSFRVRVTPTNQSYEYIDYLLDGPQNAKDVIRHELELGNPLTTIHAQLGDEQGVPLSEVPVLLGGRHGDRHDAYESLGVSTTDVNGRIHVGCQDRFLRSPQAVLFLETGFAGGERIGLEVALPRTEEFPARIELGKLRLAALPVLAAGQVVDGQGRPLNHVTLRVVLGKPRRLSGVSQIATRVNREGHFEFRTLEIDSPFRLCLERPGFPTIISEVFSPGERDIKLVMQRGGRIAITFLARSPGRAALDVILSGPAAAWDPFDSQHLPKLRGRWTNGHRVTWSGLRAGLAHFRIMARNTFGQPILEIPNVKINAEGQSSDPRLQNIDLRGKLWSARIKVVDSNQQPVVGATIRALEGGRMRQFNSSDRDGFSSLYSPRHLRDLTIQKGDQSSYFRSGDIRSGTITLKSTIDLTLHIKTATKWPTPPLFIAVRALSIESKAHWNTSRVIFDQSGKAKLRLPESGRYRLDFSFVRESPHSSSGSSNWPNPFDSRSIEIDDHETEKQIQLAVSAEDFELRLASMRK